MSDGNSGFSYAKFGLWVCGFILCGGASVILDRSYPEEMWWGIPALAAIVSARQAQVTWEKK